MKKNLILIQLLLTVVYFLSTPFIASAKIINPVLPSIIGSGDDPGSGLAYIIANVWKTFVIAGSLAFVLYFAWGAIRWLTAQGDKSKFEEGRSKIANGLIGLILLVASVAIVQFLGGVLDIPFLQYLTFDFPAPVTPPPATPTPIL